jgi:hypothetical protein
MRVEDVDTAALDDLVDDLSDLRHDLGKYIGFESRAAEPERLRAALVRDLHATREHAGRRESCWELWARLRPAALADDPDVLAIERALAALRIDLETADDRALQEAKDRASSVTAATKRLHARALAARG